MKHLELPTALGPWSWRPFYTETDARRFYDRLTPDHPRPFQLRETLEAPDGTLIATGVWLVLYRPILFN